ncbi:hypothetical protein EVAR_29746_1 [Eumeta japonica]|uniref:Uncharacterized protein n=1 Tax=Eumeta variegata TaxID=151549 RepID=A0A4C1WXW1_EUMVA|nr:hypothetical protein EVAR_29746_1 [Eumeta japonica]
MNADFVWNRKQSEFNSATLAEHTRAFRVSCSCNAKYIEYLLLDQGSEKETELEYLGWRSCAVLNLIGGRVKPPVSVCSHCAGDDGR